MDCDDAARPDCFPPAEIRRRYANEKRIAGAAKRIEAIALDITEHFRAKIQPNGFTAHAPGPRSGGASHSHGTGVAAVTGSVRA